MKLSEYWLREWVNPSTTLPEIAEQLTLAGLETHVTTEVRPQSQFTHVIVGKIIRVNKHPNADRLAVCEVQITTEKDAEPVSIVCGASNVRLGLKVATALPGATLPSGFQIQAKPLRGVRSHGMLCSVQELGLNGDSDSESSAHGIWELPDELPVGTDLWEYLELGDALLDVQITPNRGDCLSVLGMAREIAALNQLSISRPPIPSITPTTQEIFPVHIEVSAECPLYLGRLIRGLNPCAKTPLWMAERLKRLGYRSLHPIVDITNYVLLELGAPLHAFDLSTISNKIIVRLARPEESIVLLNQQAVKLQHNTLVIADENKAQAIAGIMGGQSSAVSHTTTDIFLEAAFFTPTAIAGKARQYGLMTEASYRFERGVDPTICREAMERATQLLLEICASPKQPCEVGPIVEHKYTDAFAHPVELVLRSSRIKRLLGLTLPESTITQTLTALGISCQAINDQKGSNNGVWHVHIPSWRFDLVEEVDLIEEVARIYGYHNIPLQTPYIPMQFNIPAKNVPRIGNIHYKDSLELEHFCSPYLEKLRDFWTHQGYSEIVNYSFNNSQKQQTLNPAVAPILLQNPISSELSALRTSLNLSLIQTAVYNQNRQQSRLRLFEIGSVFLAQKEGVQEQLHMGGIATGSAHNEQWGMSNRDCDFFDIKQCVQNSLELMDRQSHTTFRAIDPADSVYPALHPGQSSHILRNGQMIGYLGALHPQFIELYGLTGSVYLFEWQLEASEKKEVIKFKPLSRFPMVRRDLSFWVLDHVEFSEILAVTQQSAGELLSNCCVFDLYQPAADNKKGLTLRLIWQHPTRTLNEEEIESGKIRVLEALQKEFEIQLRSTPAGM